MDFSEYPTSVVEQDGTAYVLGRTGEGKFLRVRGNAEGFQGAAFGTGDDRFFALNAQNAAELKRRLEWLSPKPLGLKTSFGYGDRLGVATPGHIQAARGSQMAALFAQQSVRENARTGRTPQQVVDEAMWGVFEMGWREPWGADADHLKTTNDIAPFVNAGYTFFTVDPGEHVDNDAPSDVLSALIDKATALPWDTLNDSLGDLQARYVGQTFEVDGMRVTFTDESLLRAAVKYGRAAAHAVVMYHEIARQKEGGVFDFEVSVDETELPTDTAEHFYIANELARLNVRVTSLAPRFIGRFEKGVDYIGDLGALKVNLEEHAKIARRFNYKLSLHSGSDKLSVYPLFAAATRNLAHVKTAGTSYLEALRTIGNVKPKLLREILTLARERYPIDRATYHVSADVGRVPTEADVSDIELPNLLNDFDAREVFHVTFGSALAQYGTEIHATLREHATEYADTLQRHFTKHLAPFTIQA